MVLSPGFVLEGRRYQGGQKSRGLKNVVRSLITGVIVTEATGTDTLKL